MANIKQKTHQTNLAVYLRISQDDNRNLETLSISNQHYNRDLAQKSITARNTKSKRGEHMSAPPFGYKKSKEAKKDKNRLIIDEEAAE